METRVQNWTMEVSSKTNLFDLRLREVWAYKHLVFMFVKRDFISVYLQTVLGPLWYVFQPLFTTIIYTFVFGNIANIPTDGQPKVLFYMSGLTFWNLFATNFIRNSDTFISNAGIFGKVYFPRLTVPISYCFASLFSFLIQFFLFLIMYTYFILNGMTFSISWSIIFVPFYLVIVLLMSMSLGLIATSITTKYRDLKFLLSFAVQLAMWATPIVYPMSIVKNEMLKLIIELNPMTSIVEAFRYSILGVGTFYWSGLIYTIFFTVISFFTGITLFNRTEKNFIDTV
jgi:lipopolysaccharide transport system permease protein